MGKHKQKREIKRGKSLTENKKRVRARETMRGERECLWTERCVGRGVT